MTRARVAALQMVAGPEVGANLAAAGRLIAAAAGEGAKLAALPENFYLVSRDERAKVAAREADGRGPIQDFLAGEAARHGMWIVGGSVPIACDDPERIRSACLVFDAAGRRVARYDKRHLFRFANGAERYDEARTLEAGGAAVALASPFGRIGLSICYDVRFPEHYRALAPLDLILVPSAFTVPTGQAHWHVLLRARAVENLAYVLAPAQGGEHPGGRRTYGHTMIVDPWGAILAERAEGEGVVLAEIDSARLAEVRESLPALDHRRPV
jgi:nitrilase